MPPFYIDTETSVEIVAEIPAESGQANLSQKLRGRIDILVLMGQLWVLAIESKRAEFSLKVGIPQALAYMLAAPSMNRACYGLVTNGSSFLFLKLCPANSAEMTGWRYAKSQEFILDRADDLACVLQIMKALGAIAIRSV